MTIFIQHILAYDIVYERSCAVAFSVVIIKKSSKVCTMLKLNAQQHKQQNR